VKNKIHQVLVKNKIHQVKNRVEQVLQCGRALRVSSSPDLNLKP